MNPSGHPASDTPPAVPAWQRLQGAWASHSPRLRRQALVLLARELHRVWKAGYVVIGLRSEHVQVAWTGEQCDVRLDTSDLPRGRRPLPVGVLQSALARWYEQAGDHLSSRDALLFLKEILRRENALGGSLRHAVHEIRCAQRDLSRMKAKRMYEGVLHEPAEWAAHPGGALRGACPLLPPAEPREFWDAVRLAARDARTEVIKSGANGGVLRARLWEREVLIKFYTHRRFLKRFKNLLRPSRGRRAFAAARTLTGLGLDTPEPLGYLEERRNGWPGDSYFISAFLPEAVSARTWLERVYPGKPDEFRRTFRRQLLASLRGLYQRGVYHADTKASNLLLCSPDDPAQRRFFWIDLESMEFGIEPGRQRMFRNLVQLNGSLGPSVTRADRLEFLRELAGEHPWVLSPWTLRRIGLKTWWRLKKEDLGWAGQ